MLANFKKFGVAAAVAAALGASGAAHAINIGEPGDALLIPFVYGNTTTQANTMIGVTVIGTTQSNVSEFDTISGVSGTIASPVTWVEGTTKGLGFTLYGTNATSIPGKWSSGAAYAAFPGTSTSYYTRTGRQSAKDVLNMRLRLDTTMLNPAGTYTNVITTVGTVTP